MVSKRLRAFNKSTTGYEAMLPVTYGMRLEELADLLNSMCHKYAAPGSLA